MFAKSLSQTIVLTFFLLSSSRLPANAETQCPAPEQDLEKAPLRDSKKPERLRNETEDCAAESYFPFNPAPRCPVKEAKQSQDAWYSKTLDILRNPCCGPRDSAEKSPFAETIFMRENFLPRISDDVRKSIVAATISKDPDVVMDVTKSARSSDSAIERFSTNLVAAYALAKIDISNNIDTVSHLIEQLQKDINSIDYSTADVNFLSALLASARGQNKEALAQLDEALEKEKFFYNAALLAARTKLAEINNKPLIIRSQCRRNYKKLFNYLAVVLQVRPCPRQAVHAEIYLERGSRITTANGPLLAAKAYLAIVARKPAVAPGFIAKFLESADAPCQHYIQGKLGELLIEERSMNAPTGN